VVVYIQNLESCQLDDLPVGKMKSLRYFRRSASGL
jgi:hypothetical protein